MKHCQSARLYREAPREDTCSDTVSLPGCVGSTMEIIRVYSDSDNHAGLHYKSLRIGPTTTVREVVLIVLHKYRMLDKDPALFYLTLEL